MHFIKKYIRPYGLLFFSAILFLILETATDLLQPALLQKLVDQGIASKDTSAVIRMGSLMIVTVILGAFFAWIRNWLSVKVTFAFGQDLRSGLYKKIQSFSLEELNHFDRPSLLTRLTNDVNQIQSFIGGLMRIFLKAPLTILGSMLLARSVSPSLSIFIYAALPISLLFFYFNIRFLYPKYGLVQRQLDRLNAKIREFLLGIRVVFIFNAFSRERRSFEEVNQDLQSASVSSMTASALVTPWVPMLLNASMGLILYYGAQLYRQQQVTLGEIMAFINYMAQIILRTGMLAGIFNVFARARASYQRIEEIFALPSPRETFAPALPEEKILTFDEVSFTYPEATGPALSQISFQCVLGESLGIIGATGSGKTTLANLLLHFYPPSQGDIRFGGIPLAAMSTTQRGDLIAYAPQKTVLFGGTVRSNLLFAKPDASSQEMVQALKDAQAWDFIRDLAEGLDAPVAPEGNNFSGGEKQRISLARAFMKNAEILLLDDTLSKVDSHTELALRKVLKNKSTQCILLLIAQKITSVMDCDKILVLEQGCIVGYGTHHQLMDSCPSYQAIYQSQLGTEQKE